MQSEDIYRAQQTISTVSNGIVEGKKTLVIHSRPVPQHVEIYRAQYTSSTVSTGYCRGEEDITREGELAPCVQGIKLDSKSLHIFLVADTVPEKKTLYKIDFTQDTV